MGFFLFIFLLFGDSNDVKDYWLFLFGFEI
jgi:hypothetical protein